MNQTKNDFLNNNVMTLKTNVILLSYYTPAPGAIPILFHPKWVEAVCFSTKELNLFQSK